MVPAEQRAGTQIESLDIVLCRKVYETQVIPRAALCKAFEGFGKWKVERAIARLKRSGCVISRRMKARDGRGAPGHYLVLGRKGLRLIGVMNADSGHRYRDAPRAERILYSKRIAEQFVEAGLPREILVDRNRALLMLGLQSAMTALDWAIDSPLGVYTVHVKTPNNGQLVWSTIRKCTWAPGVCGHIVVCADANAVTDERRRYLSSGKRPIVRHLHVVSFEKADDFRVLVDNLVDPKNWRVEMATALYSHSPGRIRYSVPSAGENGPMARIRHEGMGVWMAGDLRTWDMALVNAAREWDPSSAKGIYRTDRLLFLVRDFKDAKAKATSLGWREHIWWALSVAPEGRALLRVQNDRLVVPQFDPGEAAASTGAE